jgi:hypothetical protein
MIDTQFQHCCGIRILSDFGNTETSLGENEGRAVQKKTIKAFIKSALEDQIKYGGKSMVLIALNAEQTEKLGKLVEDEGFKAVASGNNRPHRNNLITLYVYERKV